MTSEFDLIRRYFTRPVRHSVLGVGDDAALIAPTPGQTLVVSTDMLVAGTHFFPDTDPRDLGWKTLAVNVSDLAAMGAQPRWAVLSIALPTADERWVAAFADGFFECATAFEVDLVGGDTTRGPLALSVTIFGEVPQGEALLRSGAQLDDDIWISGTPGRAALGLAHLQGRVVLQEAAACLAALHRPQPRVALGQALRGVASAALDVSDGLLGDLTHILERSKVSARIELDRLPLPTGVTADAARVRECVLAGGDDYELLFCAPPTRRGRIEAIALAQGLPLTRIGTIVPGGPDNLKLIDASGLPVAVGRRGYDHFSGAST